MSQDLRALTTTHDPREVDWLGTPLLESLYIGSLRRPPFYLLAFSKDLN